MKFRYDIPSGEAPSVALVTVVSELLGTEPMEMGPLDRLVDLDALDQFLDGSSASAPAVASIQLELEHHVLTIHETTIVVEDAGGLEEPAEQPVAERDHATTDGSK